MVFLLSGVGFHLDLEYCCGNLERLGLFDNLSVMIEDCCEGKPVHDDCMDEDHVVKEMEAQELISLSNFKLEQVSSFELPTVHTLPDVHNWLSTGGQLEYSRCDLPPPDLVLLQRFLC